MRFSSLFLMPAVLALASCSALQKKEPPPCPKVSVLADAAQATLFRPGPGRDLTDVEAEVEVVGYQGSCVHREKSIDLVLQVGLQLRRGPADTDRKTEVSYFVAAPGFFPKAGAKAVMPVVVNYPDNVDLAQYMDEEVTISLPWTEGDTLSKYEVFVGLQLSPEQLDYNRRQRQR